MAAKILEFKRKEEPVKEELKGEALIEWFNAIKLYDYYAKQKKHKKTRKDQNEQVLTDYNLKRQK